YADDEGYEPVKDFILRQPDGAIAEILHVLKLLREFNVSLQMPYVRKIDKSGLRELRIKHGSDIYRIFFSALEGQKFVLLHAYDNGWTTNLPLEDFLASDALITDLHDGEPLSADHGGPVRAIVPLLYAWKSAKWLKAIEFSAEDKPGYWERGGYHSHGDPWVVDETHVDGERFQDPSLTGSQEPV
ncbi:MAG: molybdopterin-dependent oxidoreductase, partial [Planctomycetia bacterium]|nr:molybdopterin-dependent oxidoreductase [Planctomycetia bacterium]